MIWEVQFLLSIKFFEVPDWEWWVGKGGIGIRRGTGGDLSSNNLNKTSSTNVMWQNVVLLSQWHFGEMFLKITQVLCKKLTLFNYQACTTRWNFNIIKQSVRPWNGCKIKLFIENETIGHLLFLHTPPFFFFVLFFLTNGWTIVGLQNLTCKLQLNL